MRASAVEYRLRMLINATIIVLGIWSPWIEAWGIGRRISLLEWLALELSRVGILRFSVATPVVILAAALMAAVGAILRVWGTAYLGPATVNHLDMKAGVLMAGGPYRYLRNPLYAGLWFMAAAIAFLMPPTGALFTIVLLSVFLLRLTLGEERYLASELGQPYQVYLKAVPRLMPRFSPAIPQSGAKPHWLGAILAELTPVGVFVAFAFFAWGYDNRLVGRVILIGFGLSLVTRAFIPVEKRATPAA